MDKQKNIIKQKVDLKLSSDHKSTLLVVFFSLLFIGLSAIFHYTIGGLEMRQLVIVLSSTFAVVFVCVYFSLRLSRAKHEEIANEMIEKMYGVIEIAEGRVVIDNRLLKFIEKEASKIWVITKTLENDVLDKDISETVLENLKSERKHYWYFIPDPDQNPTIRRNKRTYGEMYKDYLDHVTFIVLPENTLFMFDEIVIYNPDQKDLFGYTYIDLEGSGKRDQVVRIAKENVEAIIDSLTKLISPKKERQERLIRMVMNLAERVVLEKNHISFLVGAIVSGKLSIEERRDFEDRLKGEGLDKNQMQEIQKVVNQIIEELQKS